MTTERVRFKDVRAGRLLDVIEEMQGKEEFDSGTLEAVAQRIDKMAFLEANAPGSQLLRQWQVNEPFEVADLLQRLNETISTFCMLSDTNYYLDYIFNAGTAINEGVEKLGITEEWLSDIAEKLKALRSLLYGDCINWNEMSVTLMRNAAYATREDNRRLEDRNRTLKYKLGENKE